jgi:hypothetical protein
MATVFDSLFQQAGFPLLLEQFGESIEYVPRSGGSRTIDAIVVRDPPAIMDAAGNAVIPQFTLRVYNSCRSGISSKEMDTGGDQVRFVGKIGEVIPKTYTVGQIISQSGGVLNFSVV